MNPEIAAQYTASRIACVGSLSRSDPVCPQAILCRSRVCGTIGAELLGAHGTPTCLTPLQLVSPSVEGTPQGGPLLPLLSNLVLDELGLELERRGHHFVRYADGCNIDVRSEPACQRVMTSITRFITQKLKLKVNEAKSAVA